MGYDIQKGNELYSGFSSGFSLHYSGARTPSDSKNLKSANINADIVKQKIQAEIDAGRVAGPFDSRPIPTLRVSPLGLVPKREPGELAELGDKFLLLRHSHKFAVAEFSGSGVGVLLIY